MDNMKISVIIPVYNMEKYLEDCLQSVVRQTIFSDLEIICVNDGSKDRSEEILAKYATDYKNIVVINQENTGVAIARNNGIKAATGEFIAFMDPDDFYIENDSLEILYSKAKEHDVKICGGSICSVSEDGKFVRKTGPKQSIFTEEKLIDYKDYQWDFGYYRFIFNREFLVENDIYFPDLIRFQDPPFFVEAMIKAEKFYAIPNYTYCYRFGHQKFVWQERRICDLIKGHIADLKLSADANLGELHALTIERLALSNITKEAITAGMLQNFTSIPELLHEAEKSIKLSILPQECKTKSIWQFYFDYFTIAERNKIEKKELSSKLKASDNKLKASDNKLKNAENQLKKSLSREEALKNSVSFRVGRAITWGPRKVRGGARCYKQHGASYTIKRLGWHITHLK